MGRSAVISPTDTRIYDADYYLRGRESGLSLYHDYRWIPELTIPMAQRIAEALPIEKHHTVLDFGCARGYTVRALRELGYQAYGTDVSQWAIDNCDRAAGSYLFQPFQPWEPNEYDWILAKDVLEHIPDVLLGPTIERLLERSRRGVFVVVPLSVEEGEPYIVPEYEQDVTHVQRKTLGGWMSLLAHDDFETAGCYRMQGVKDNYSHFERGNGFLFVRRKVIR